MPAQRSVLRLLLLGVLLVPSWIGAQPGVAGTPSSHAACGAPPELLADTAGPLSATAAALSEGKLRILVAGSASVFGPGTSGGTDTAWPQRLRALLAERFPGPAIELTVRGGRGLTAAESAALLVAELPRLHPQLVIWQSGTVDAVRSLELDQVTDTLNATAEQILASGADLVLMDQQFSRFLRANTNVEPYRDAIRLVAVAHGAALLRRYEMMQFWAETDRIDLERAAREMRPIVADRLNACLAEALADLIRQGVQAARDKPAAASGRP